MNYRVLFEESCSELEQHIQETDSDGNKISIDFGDILYYVFSAISSERKDCYTIEDVLNIDYKTAYESISKAVIKEKRLNARLNE